MEKNVTSIRLDPAGVAHLDRYGKPRSEQGREDIQVLQALLRAGERSLVGVFTPGEACLVVDSLNGHFFVAGVDISPEALAGGIDDAIHLDSLAEKWGIDGPALVKKLAALNALQVYTMHHWARLVWAAKEPHDFQVLISNTFRV